jgi:hypothetical protein
MPVEAVHFESSDDVAVPPVQLEMDTDPKICIGDSRSSCSGADSVNQTN